VITAPSITVIALTAATKSDPDRLRAWALRKADSRGPHKSAAAVANKLARIAWALWTRQIEYRAIPNPV